MAYRALILKLHASAFELQRVVNKTSFPFHFCSVHRSQPYKLPISSVYRALIYKSNFRLFYKDSHGHKRSNALPDNRLTLTLTKLTPKINYHFVCNNCYIVVPKKTVWLTWWFNILWRIWIRLLIYKFCRSDELYSKWPLLTITIQTKYDFSKLNHAFSNRHLRYRAHINILNLVT